MPRKSIPPFTLPDALLSAFDTNDRINQYLLENLPVLAWRANPPSGSGRTVAAIVAHMHNVGVMWLKATKGSVPAQIEKGSVTPAQARKALEESRGALREVIERALKTDVAGFVGYLIAHDAHHRGQVTMLARQLGHPLPQKTMFGMWEWGVR